MALDIFTGDSVPALLARAREALGPEAAVVQIRRRGNGFELLASAAASPTPPVLAPERPHVKSEVTPFDQVLAAELRQTATRPAPATPRIVSPAPPTVAPVAPLVARAGSKLRPRTIALVGPTGAGKTTTIAKLATHSSVFGRKRVGLLGLDTYRVGAVEQLRTWGELAGASVAIAHDEVELRRAMARLIECDVVLVDTPGRGPRRQADASLIESWLRLLQPDEVHLVLPAGQMPQVTRRHLADYRSFGVTHVVASKIDECPEDVRLFDIATDAGLPMRWITNGQDVPGDLDAAANYMADAVHRRMARPGAAA